MDHVPDSNRNGVAHMRDAVLFDGADRGQRLSRFWILLTLSSTIAAAGVVADSTATVIGAMIVAPMMLPIQGTMLSTVLGDRVNLVRSVVLVLWGAAVAVGIGFAVGLLVSNDVVAATNSQVAGRVSPGLIDLLAALGTGVVGSIALVRRDISDTLPGVAIAISLVPPLAVVGLTFEAGALDEALGAALLFITNVAAILATGIIVMAAYKVRALPVSAPGRQSTVDRLRAVVVIATMLVVVGVPLTLSTVSSSSNALREAGIRAAAQTWAGEVGWAVLSVRTELDRVVVLASGALPLPDTARLAALVAGSGIDAAVVRVELVPTYVVDLKPDPSGVGPRE